jgi:hypothetical protein
MLAPFERIVGRDRHGLLTLPACLPRSSQRNPLAQAVEIAPPRWCAPEARKLNRNSPVAGAALPAAAEPGVAAQPLARGSRIQNMAFWNTHRRSQLAPGRGDAPPRDAARRRRQSVNRNSPAAAVAPPAAAEPGFAAQPLARGSRIQTMSFWNTHRRSHAGASRGDRAAEMVRAGGEKA